MKKNLEKSVKSGKRIDDLLKEAREYEESLINERQIVDILKECDLCLSPTAIRDIWNCVNHSEKCGHLLDHRPTIKEHRRKLKEIKLAAKNLMDCVENIESPLIFPGGVLRDSAVKLSSAIIHAVEAETKRLTAKRGRKKVHSVKFLLSQLIAVIESYTNMPFLQQPGITGRGGIKVEYGKYNPKAFEFLYRVIRLMKPKYSKNLLQQDLPIVLQDPYNPLTK